LIGAAIGYALGLFFSRGIRAIILPDEVAALTEIRYAVAGAGILGVLSFIYAYRINFDGEVRIGMIIYAIVRTTMNIVRAIEPLIWALVGIIWVGPGPFAGMIALTLHTIAALGKLYSESIESIDPGPLEAIQATGGDRLQTIIYAVIPQVLPPFISFTIYRWDINVRLSTVIGLVGGGGIGFILIQWIRQFQYEAAGLAVWLIAITVSVLDYVSSEIREKFV
jgi:phosphonate transport system permease protein